MSGDGLARAALADLVERLAADDPAPGAGPAAAWACAMAAALVEMVTAVELRREPAEPETVRARGERAAALRARALELADLDVAAYTGVLDVLARRDEPGHGGRLRQALAEAAGPPLEIARTAAEATRLAAEAAAVARGGVRGEAVAAAVLGEAAVRAAVPLVEINLAGHREDPRLAEAGELARAAAADLERARTPPGRRAPARLPTRLTERFGLAHPVVLAPMAFAAGGRIAAAVSRAGGLGLIGGGYGDVDWIDAQFAEAGDAEVGCGLITWALAKNPGVARPRARPSPARAHALLRRPAPLRPGHSRGGRAAALPGPDGRRCRRGAGGGCRRCRRAGRGGRWPRRPARDVHPRARGGRSHRPRLAGHPALRGGRHRRRPRARRGADPRRRRRRRRLPAVGDGGGAGLPGDARRGARGRRRRDAADQRRRHRAVAGLAGALHRACPAQRVHRALARTRDGSARPRGRGGRGVARGLGRR